MASSSPVPPIANEPARGEHTRAQPTALANLKSNSATYAEAVMRSVPDVKQRTRTNDNGRVHPANAASSLATAGTEPPMSPTVLRHNLADNAEAAALQAAADAAAAAVAPECDDVRVLRAVLMAAAATANALAQTIPPDTVLAHRRGGRPPPTRRANPRPRPRRTRRPTGMHTGTPAPTATGTSTARQSRQLSAIANSPPRAGQARPQPGARPPSFSSNRSAALATRNFPPQVEPTVMRLNGRD